MIALLYRCADRLRGRYRSFGSRGEDLAYRFLRKNRFTVVARCFPGKANGGFSGPEKLAAY